VGSRLCWTFTNHDAEETDSVACEAQLISVCRR
jgi:hypothetical protein